MKKLIKVLAFLMLVSTPLISAGGKPEIAPGIQKKSLEIFGVEIVLVDGSTILSWETNYRASCSVNLYDYFVETESPGLRHSIVIPFVIADRPTFRIFAYSEIFGSAPPYDVNVTP